jgi:hypothetical protein
VQLEGKRKEMCKNPNNFYCNWKILGAFCEKEKGKIEKVERI